MNVTIRQGTEKDLPALLLLVRELAIFEKSPESVENSIEKMTLEKDLFKFFLAESNGEAVGMVVYFFAYSTWVGKTLYVDDLYVREAYRGQKIGTSLLREIFQIAKSEDCGRLRWQVSDSNEGAKDFYKKKGAKITNKLLNCDFNKASIAQFLTQTDS